MPDTTGCSSKRVPLAAGDPATRHETVKTITVVQTRSVAASRNSDTILEAALRSGQPYPHGCRSGRCGACKSRLVNGAVEHLSHSRFALTEDEKQRGLFLACRAAASSDVTVSWLGSVEDTPDHPVVQRSLEVIELADATHDIKRVRLREVSGAGLAFSAGQFARLTFPGAPTRDYSMASPPWEEELEFHIRKVPGGAATEVIWRSNLGDVVQLEGPFGDAHFRESHDGPIVCVAGGSGLAPIKSIVETALAFGVTQPVAVYFGAREERDLYLVQHFHELAARHPNLSFTPMLSAAGPGSALRRGMVSDLVSAQHAELLGSKVYVAGPPQMVDAMWNVMHARSGRPGDFHADVFFTPGAAAP